MVLETGAKYIHGGSQVERCYTSVSEVEPEGQALRLGQKVFCSLVLYYVQCCVSVNNFGILDFCDCTSVKYFAVQVSLGFAFFLLHGWVFGEE